MSISSTLGHRTLQLCVRTVEHVHVLDNKLAPISLFPKTQRIPQISHNILNTPSGLEHHTLQPSGTTVVLILETPTSRLDIAFRRCPWQRAQADRSGRDRVFEPSSRNYPLAWTPQSVIFTPVMESANPSLLNLGIHRKVRKIQWKTRCASSPQDTTPLVHATLELTLSFTAVPEELQHWPFPHTK